MRFSGAVLCGGASRRMGRDKALLPIDGVAMAARAAAALTAAGAVDVCAIGGDAAALGALGLRVVPDDEPGEGPFPATLTALRSAREEAVLVVSCDLVDPDPDVLATLVDALASAPPATLGAVPVVDGHHQWTHAAWRRSALPRLEHARARGIGSLKRAASGLPILVVHGLPSAALADADTRADLPGGGRRGGSGAG